MKIEEIYKSFLYALPLLLAGALAVLMYKGLNLPSPYQPLIQMDKPVPEEIGNIETPSMINVFASWCYECVLEMPVLKKIALKVPVYGLNYWDQDASSWLDKHGNPYTRVVYDFDGIISSQMSVIGVPETFLVNKNGVIKIRIIGQVTDDVVNQVVTPWMIENGVVEVSG